MFFSTWAACVPLLLSAAAVAQYNLVKEYAGERFFDDWTFYGHSEFTYDVASLFEFTLTLRHFYSVDNLTNGDVTYALLTLHSSMLSEDMY